jgi:hypothetical protein
MDDISAHLVRASTSRARSEPLQSGDWGIIVDPRGWLLVIRGNPANAAEGLGSVSPGDPIWLTAARD